MIDGYGRKIDYIRISVTDRCNLRCVYCLPEEGVELTSHSELLTFDEMVRVCEVLASLGISKVKLTGGEPLLRRGFCSLVKSIKAIPGIDNVTVTTNGVLLEDMYDDLVAAGIDCITVSMDTVDPELFQKITRRDELERVKRGLMKALTENRVPVKLNCVPVYGMDEEKLLDLVKLAEDYPLHIRFIEMMPIGLGKAFPFVNEEEIRRLLEKHYGSFEDADDVPGNGPGHYFRVPGLKGRIGFISAISHKFCDRCNRVRLTSTGYLKTCLQYDYGNDLRHYLRHTVSNEDLKAVIVKTLEEKPAHHCFGEEGTAARETKGMSQIGG